MKKATGIIAALLLTASTLAAATHEGVPFNGQIIDHTGKPVKNARIWTADPERYATSDKKGRFGLTDVDPADTLHVKIKKQQFAIPVDGAPSMRIVFIDENHFSHNQDEEMVNLGYEWVKHRERTASTNGFSGERLVATGASTILEALKGLVPGLYFGPGGTVNIRGQHSIMGDSTPLFVLDGTIVGSLDFVNLSSVDHVEVLKDAPMYGSRGANGAIIVTTKRK